jgi:hypothetical protein
MDPFGNPFGGGDPFGPSALYGQSVMSQLDPRFQMFAASAGQGGKMFGAPVTPPSMTPFNMPGLTGSPIINAFQPMLMQAVMAKTGLNPGEFFPMHSFARQQRDAALMAQMQAAQAQGARQDFATAQRVTRRIGAAMGLSDSFTDQLASGMTSPGGQMVFQGVMGAMGMSPDQSMDLLDQMHGRRGSASLLSQRLVMAGTRMVDPVTRATGLSSQSAVAVTEALQREKDASATAFSGLRLGQLGSLYEDLGQRGLLGRGVGTMNAQERRRAFAQDLGQQRGMSAADISKQMNSLMGEVESIADVPEKVRQLDANRITNKLKDMSKAVAAMKAIFTDMGNPNASMGQIMQGLSDLTQGGINTSDPAKIANSVMTSYVMGERTGAGIGGMATSIARSGQMAAQYGLSQSMGVRIGQLSTSFGRAVAEIEGGVIGSNKLTADEAVMRQEQLLSAASSSDVGMRLAAFGMYRQAVGGGGTVLDEMLAGRASVGSIEDFDKALNANFSREDAARVQAMAVGNPELAKMFMRDNPQAMLSVRRGMLNDAVERIGGETEGVLSRNGIAGNKAGGMSRQLVSDIFQNMPDEARSGPKAMQEWISKQITAQDPDIGPQQAGLMAMEYLGALEQSPFVKKRGGLNKVITEMNPKVLEESIKRQAEDEQEAARRNELNKIGVEGPVERVFGLLAGESDMSTPEGQAAALGKFLGGYSDKALADQLGGMAVTEEEIKRLGVTDVKTFGVAAGALHDTVARKMQIFDQRNESDKKIQGQIATLEEERKKEKDPKKIAEIDRKIRRLSVEGDLARRKFNEEQGKLNTFEAAIRGGAGAAGAEKERMIGEIVAMGVSEEDAAKLAKGDIDIGAVKDKDGNLVGDKIKDKFGDKAQRNLRTLDYLEDQTGTGGWMATRQAEKSVDTRRGQQIRLRELKAREQKALDAGLGDEVESIRRQIGELEAEGGAAVFARGAAGGGDATAEAAKAIKVQLDSGEPLEVFFKDGIKFDDVEIKDDGEKRKLAGVLLPGSGPPV